MDRVPITQWIAWIIAAAVGGFSLLSFSYATFETKDHARESSDILMNRLDRMEEKLDRLIERRR
jgi:hypothetical protein